MSGGEGLRAENVSRVHDGSTNGCDSGARGAARLDSMR